jgi:hypothetical protein
MPDVHSPQLDCRCRFRAAIRRLRARHTATACRMPARRVKFCKGKGEDPGVLLSCLEENKDKISEKCRKVIEQN